jgi:TP901 family phage tail tape measure protein
MPASVLEVLITGDATQLKAAYVQAGTATQEFAAATASSSAATKEASATSAAFGQAANKAFTYAKLGALAFAAVSVKAAIDFNREFTLIAAITNTAASRIDSLKGTVMELSHETGIAPTELAHSLYFLASAGLSTTQQMQALDATAHAAAVGLGDAGDLARITANALNAFADQGLTATQVMDTLVAAVREGTAEPDAFAQALGRVLPIADNAGISFQQVAASLATMSNAGLDVNEGVTALRAILQSLIAPTAQTTNAFATMGLTVTDVVSSMQGQGLIATLRMLQDRAKAVTDSTGEYNQLLRHAIPNIRGLAGALNLTGQDATKVNEIFQAVVNSNGDLAKAFATTAQSDAFKLQQAFNDIRNAGQQLATSVLPEIASGLELVARNTKLVVAAFATWAAFKVIAPMLRDIAAANEAVAASEANVAAAQVTAGATGVAAGVGGVAAGGGAIASQSIFARASAARAAAAAEAEAAAAEAEAGAAAAAAEAPIVSLGAASVGTSGALAGVGNAIGSRFLPQIFALIQGVQDADTEFRTFHEGVAATLQSVASSQTVKTFASSIGGIGASSIFGGAISQVASTLLGAGAQADAATQKLTAGIQTVQAGFLALGYTANQQAQITTAALADIGAASLADVNPSNIDAYVTAVQSEIDKSTQAAAVAKQQAAAQLELTKQTQASKEASTSWQQSTAQMTDHLAGLSRIGINVNDFMSQLQSDLAGSTDQTKTFGDAIGQITKAWTDFKAQAQTALFFIPSALNDLTSAAQQAQDQLDSMTKSSTATNSEVAQLRSTASLTGQDILSSFQQANAQSRDFFQNLLDISKVGGSAGKDLAASLLQSGNVVAANIIAHSKLQKQITSTFGTGEDMASKFATKLTDSIVGPLDDITKILAKIGQSLGVKGLDIYLNDHGAKKKAEDTKKAVDNLTGKDRKLNVYLDDHNSKKGVHDLQGDVDHLVTGAHRVMVGTDTSSAHTALRDFDTTLNTFTSKDRIVRMGVDAQTARKQLSKLDSDINAMTSKQRLIDIGVHIHPKSPWPDEAMQTHLVDPMKATGFKRVGDAWTLPLNVGMHNDPSTFPGPKGPRGKQTIPGLDELRRIEQRQLQVLFDIRREIKSGGGGGGGAGGTGTSSGTTGGAGGTGGPGHPHGSLHQTSPLPQELQRQLKDFGLYVKSVQGPMYGDRFVREMTKALKTPGIGKNEVGLLHQAMRDMAKVTNPEEAHKAADAWRKAARDLAATQRKRQGLVNDHGRLHEIATPLQRAVHDIFQKQFKGGLTPGEAKGVIARVAREGRDPKFIGGAIKDMAKELGPAAAKEFGHSLRSLDASTAHNAKHQQDALDAARDAFKQMTQQSKSMTQKEIKQQQARQAANKQWMADALTYATHNVPKLPRGHTHISVNHHEHHRREVRLDRKRFVDSAGYEVDYARGF